MNSSRLRHKAETVVGAGPSAATARAPLLLPVHLKFFADAKQLVGRIAALAYMGLVPPIHQLGGDAPGSGGEASHWLAPGRASMTGKGCPPARGVDQAAAKGTEAESWARSKNPSTAPPRPCARLRLHGFRALPSPTSHPRPEV